jgi:hypothetical protein
MTDRILRFARRRRVAASCLFSLLLVTPAFLLTASHVERAGRDFYRTGKDTVDLLARLADALEAGDVRGVAAAHAPTFAGEPLALVHPALADDRDGVLVYRFRSPGGRVTRDGAVEGWMRYLAGFDSVDKVEMHVHRLEDWEEPETVATVRFELIGTPVGAPRAGIDRAIFRMRFRSEDGTRTIVGAELVEGDRVIGRRPQFTDVAPAAGVAFENRYYPPFLSVPLRFVMLRYGPAGITAADYDDDGLYDLFVPDGVESRLFHNRGDGGFDDVTAGAGLSGLSGVHVALFADYDDDGHKDLFVSRTFDPNQLFHANGDGTFSDVTLASGIGADCCTTSASWADYDLDGDLDLYVGRYLEPREEIPTTFYARNGLPNRLYRNEGDGTFTDVTGEAGVAEPGLCLGSVFGDYDDDGDPDLYVVNDFGRNTLYRNEGGGRFEDVTTEANALAYGAGMNASFGDYDNDGRLDAYVTNIRSEFAWYGEQPTVRRYMLNSLRQGVWLTDLPLYAEIVRQSGFHFKEVFQQMGSGNTLLHNRGPGAGGVGFDDVTWAAGANPPGWFWGASFADFDNDGWQDLYAANGWVYGEPDTEIELEFFEGVVGDQKRYKSGAFFDPGQFGGRSWHGWERNRHLRNNRDGTFTEIGRAVGTDLLLNSRGVAVADFWNRGMMDIAVSASTDTHALLANRLDSGRHWLQVELRGAGPGLPDGSNRDAVGARVAIRAGGGRQLREVVLGDGYASQNSLRLHFGLGEAARVDELIVTWPRSGQVQHFRGVAADRIVEVTEGVDELREMHYPSLARLPEPGPAAVGTAP